MKTTLQTENSQTKSNFVNNAFDEIEESIQIMMNGGKITW